MKILAKIRAFFTLRNEPKEIQLAAAEIRGNRVILYSADKPHTAISMRASAVDLYIDPGKDIDEETLMLSGSRKKTLDPKERKVKPNQRHSVQKASEQPYKTPMKTISFRVYEDEYDAVMSIINENGYRKAEYMLACVYSAKKKSLESAYNRYYDAHRERRKADREAAKLFRKKQSGMTDREEARQ